MRNVGRLLAVLALVTTAVLLSSRSARAAGEQFTAPSSPTTATSDTSGNPQPFTVSATGFPQGLIYLEICDGTSPSAPAYDPNVHCDSESGGSPVLSNGPTSTITFAANDPTHALRPFRGQGPGGEFNCLAPEDVKPGTQPAANGSVTPIGATTKNGVTIDTSQPSWTNCQLRVSNNITAASSDQIYQTFSLANSGARLTPNVTVAAAPKNLTARTPTPISTTVKGSGAAPTGTVTVSDLAEGQVFALADCTAVPVTNGVAACTTAHLVPGTNELMAAYSGDAVYAQATSAKTAFHASAAPAASGGGGPGKNGSASASSGGKGKNAVGAAGGKAKSGAGSTGSTGHKAKGTSGGTIALIVILVVVVVGLAGGAVLMARRRRRATVDT